jgi:hypothetical protein
MIKKRYTAPGLFKITVKVNGEFKTVSFTGYNPTDKTRAFETADKVLQEALESTKAFKSLFTLQHTITTDEPKPAPKEEGKLEVKTFVNLPQAKKWLAEMGKEVGPGTKTHQAEKLAEELGFELKFNKQKTE